MTYSIHDVTHLISRKVYPQQIASCYGLHGPGIESRWGQYFPYPSRLALGRTKPPIKWVLGLSLGSKVTGAWH